MRKRLVLHTAKQKKETAFPSPPSREELFAQLREEVAHAVNIPRKHGPRRSTPQLLPIRTKKMQKPRAAFRFRALRRRAEAVIAPGKPRRLPMRCLFLAVFLLALLFSPTQTSRFAVAADTIIAGNEKNFVFHNQSCRYFPQAKVWLDSKQQAISKGYRPCGHCGG